MTSCCSSPGNDEVFTAATARRDARRYRRRGLVARERRLVDPVLAGGVVGARVLEIGGGVGQLQLALLDAGARSATNLELSPHYEREAAGLAADAGHAADVRRVLGDAAGAPDLPPADVVLLHRVLCCTDDWRAMLDTALASGPDVVGLTLPQRTWFARLVAGFDRLARLVTRTSFRMRLHDPAAVLAHVEQTGLRVVHDGRRAFWRTVVLSR